MSTTNRKRREISVGSKGSEENSRGPERPRQEKGWLHIMTTKVVPWGLGLLLVSMWLVNAGITSKSPPKSELITPRSNNHGRTGNAATSGKRKVVTAFLDTSSHGSSHKLVRWTYPSVQSCDRLTQDLGTAFVNTFGTLPANQTDPFLPWLHDFFLSADGRHVVFVGQNRRNCDTGKDRQQVMQFWEPQIALFQPIPVVRTDYINGSSSFRLFHKGRNPHGVTKRTEAHDPSNHEIRRQHVVPETRFLCRFHWQTDHNSFYRDETSAITLSRFPFNYEYVTWRKKSKMLSTKDRSAFWISQLMFYCPIPPEFESIIKNTTDSSRQLLVDVIPIRNPPRSQVWLTPAMVGQDTFESILASTNSIFDLTKEFASEDNLPAIKDSGRLANLPVCPRTHLPTKASSAHHQASLTSSDAKPYRLVLCTWTSASYHRRGEDEELPVEDTSLRIREWLLFHRLVGFDHVVLYDNTQGIASPQDSPLYSLIAEFDPSFVTHIPWPALICNNHRPGHAHPGDRSSQYAAEASCRERFGPVTDWLAFIDTDEYLAPMRQNRNADAKPVTWKPILDDMDQRSVAIMKFKSGRSYPRIQMMVPLEDQQACSNPVTERFLEGKTPQRCLVPRRNETYLKVYNCDSIKRPRPERFQRAMKQLYRPDYVLSHFVHYATVTEFTARYFDPRDNPVSYFGPSSLAFDSSKEAFVDELEEGTLIHARSVLPKETMFRNEICQLNYSRTTCFLGFECPDSVEWKDDLGRQNGSRVKKTMNLNHDGQGNFCSCWVNNHVEQVWIPLLEQNVAEHMESLMR